MVVIRLQRRGTNNVPHHRVVVMKRSAAQNSRVLEILGQYDPSRKPPLFKVDESRIAYWLSSGAQVSETVVSLMKHFKRASIATLRRGGA